MTLTPRQFELLERVCLKRYTVTFDHYMGSFRPNESVRVTDSQGDPNVVGGNMDNSFRPSTAEALRAKGLVRFVKPRKPDGTRDRYADHSIIRPTEDGLGVYMTNRAKP